MSIKGKLNRMKNHLSVSEKPTPTKSMVPTPKMDIPFFDKWKKLDCVPHYFDNTYSLIREVKYPMYHQHGYYQFKQLYDVHQEWKEKRINHPLSSKDVPIEDFMFFDTETTGLSNGAGNYIFLIGYAMVKEQEIVVKQHFIPGPSSEVPMYQAFFKDFNDNTKMVSYNGKSFDWPQVKTRHTFVRDQVPALPEFGHFDLLHAARRLWKHVLPSCKLSVVEKEILGYVRVDDTPGYLAPMLYFDFLQERDPDYIEGIIKHNEWDVLSLISLYTHISSAVLNENPIQLRVRERYEIGRWFDQIGDMDLAIYYYEHALLRDDPLEEDVRIALATCYKKIGLYEESKKILEEYYSVQTASRIEGLIELSKIYEHQFKDSDSALNYADQALAFLLGTPNTNVTNLKDVEHRIKRLENKCKSARTKTK